MNAQDYELDPKFHYRDRRRYALLDPDLDVWADGLASRIAGLPGADEALAYYRAFASFGDIVESDRASRKRAWYRNFQYIQLAHFYIFAAKALAALNRMPFPITEAYGHAALEAACEGYALEMTADLQRGIFIEWHTEGVDLGHRRLL